MSTVSAIARSCPAWCAQHVGGIEDGDELHRIEDVEGVTLEGRWAVGANKGDQYPATVDALTSGQMTPAQARAFARQIIETANTVDDSLNRTGRRFALRVYDVLTAGDIPLDVVEAVAEAIGVHWYNLLANVPDPALGTRPAWLDTPDTPDAANSAH